jgi:hypothetical protein
MFKISKTKTPNTSRAWKTYSTSSPRDRRFPSRKRSGPQGRGCRSPCQLCRWLVDMLRCVPQCQNRVKKEGNLTCQTNSPKHLWKTSTHRPARPQNATALRRGRWRKSSSGSGPRGFGVRCLVPLSVSARKLPFGQRISLLTSNLAIRIRIPAGVKASRGSCEVHDWQSFTLEIAPVQAVTASFVVGVVVVGVGGFDFGDVPFYADEANCCVEVSLC